jgi:hypothetical protein
MPAKTYQADSQADRAMATAYGYLYKIKEVVTDTAFLRQCELAAQAGQSSWLRAVWKVTQLEKAA